jgi:hypothetical protein
MDFWTLDGVIVVVAVTFEFLFFSDTFRILMGDLIMAASSWSESELLVKSKVKFWIFEFLETGGLKTVLEVDFSAFSGISASVSVSLLK